MLSSVDHRSPRHDRRVNVLEGLPMRLSEEASRSVSTWLFELPALDGEAVSVYFNLTLNLRLE